MDHTHWMTLAIEQARLSIAQGQSPFGAVVVRKDQLVAAGHNEVWHRCDPTAHAETVTIQKAAAAIKTIDLSGCVMYSTSRPCQDCERAAAGARIARMYVGAEAADAGAPRQSP